MVRLAQAALERAETEEEKEQNEARREGPMQLKGHTIGFWHTWWFQLRDGRLRWFSKQRHCTENRKELGMIGVTQLRQIAMDKDTRAGLYFHLTAHDGVTYSFYAREVETGKLWLDDIKKSIACEQEKKRIEVKMEVEKRREASQVPRLATSSPSASDSPMVAEGEMDSEGENRLDSLGSTAEDHTRIITWLLVFFAAMALVGAVVFASGTSNPGESTMAGEGGVAHDMIDL